MPQDSNLQVRMSVLHALGKPCLLPVGLSLTKAEAWADYLRQALESLNRHV